MITNGRSGQRSRVKVTEVKTQLSGFRTITPVWFHIWWWNDAQSLMLFRRGALLIVNAICQISRSRGSKNRWFRTKFGVSGLYLQFEFTNGYGIMHKVWSSIKEEPYCFSRSPLKFQGHRAKTIIDFGPNWDFQDCNSSLNSQIAMKWCSNLEVA